MALAFPIVMIVFNASTVAVLWFGAKRIEAGTCRSVRSRPSWPTSSGLMSVMMATFMAMMIRASVSAGIAEGPRHGLERRRSERPHAAPVRTGATPVRGRHVQLPGAEAPVLRGSRSPRSRDDDGGHRLDGSGEDDARQPRPTCLFDVTEGTLRIGDVDIRRRARDLWAHIGLVPQRPYLFTGRSRRISATATGRLRRGSLAGARGRPGGDFVRQMPDRLDSAVSQGGGSSGGQRQRIASRALVARPAVYLFDDSFSALDTATDARLRRGLVRVTRDAVVIVVAQRVSTIVDADQIVVIDDGAVVGTGTHDELLRTCPTYQEIVTSQETGREAA